MSDIQQFGDSEEDFTHRMAERFRAALPHRNVEVSGPLQLCIDLGPQISQISIHRIFKFCTHASAEECEASVSHFVASQADAVAQLDAPVTPDRLRVAVRNADYCAALYDEPGGPGGLLIRPFLPGLCMVLVADHPEWTRSVSADQLDRIGLTVDRAWSLAEDQTLAELPSPEEIDGLERCAVMLTDRRYLSTLLVDVSGWTALRERHGDLLVAVPESYSLFVTRLDRVGNMEALKAVIHEHFETAERGISDLVYRFGAGGWEPAL